MNIDRQEIERWVAIAFLGMMLIFGISDLLGMWGDACTCYKSYIQ